MLERLLPQSIDNAYRGRRSALWLFGLAAAVRAAQALLIIFDGRNVARDADGIPLESYPAGAAQNVVALFAQGAVSRLVIVLLCVLALARYRSAVPFMFVVLMLAYLAGQAVSYFVPVVRAGTPPGPAVNFVTFVVMAVGLALSLWGRRVGGASL